jgi:WD40 repeat protein
MPRFARDPAPPAARWLAVAAGTELTLIDLNANAIESGPGRKLPDPANDLTFSGDGRWLAASTAAGRLRVWHLGAESNNAPMTLEAEDSSGHTASLAFAPDSRRIVAGDQAGGIRLWDLPAGKIQGEVPGRRGQVAGLSASANGRFLLQMTRDWRGLVWDLEEGRGLLPIEGQWTSGAIAPDGVSLYLTAADDGEVRVVDRTTGLALPRRFERPPARSGPGVAPHRFDRVTVSPDGRLIAAGAAEGPLACVWEAASGRLVHVLAGHLDPHPITALAFSADSGQLLTASEDGTAKLWDLAGPPSSAEPLATFSAREEGDSPDLVPISAAALAPAGSRRVAAGTLKGQVLLWDKGASSPMVLGRMEYAVLAMAFTSDGRWLAATGADKTIWLWELSTRARAFAAPKRVLLEPLPHHTEQIGALVAWTGGKLLVSGSDDGTIRFWSLVARRLLGTISAEQGSDDWVAFTPDGLFDSSIGGERQVTWRDDHGVLALEQVFEQYHTYKLTAQLRRGTSPAPPQLPRRPPPRLSIDLPAMETTTPAAPAVVLTIALGEPGLVNLRLYQNGIAIRSDPDFNRGPDQRRVTAEVVLRPGPNRFHALAARGDVRDVEGRSETVEVRSDVTGAPGRLHVLALGVGDYRHRARALEYAGPDARQLAEFLHQCGVRSGAAGTTIVLTDWRVNETNVNQAFTRIRDQVKDRPEDTVVVFLAGHADLLDDRFMLLLPSFAFRDEPPARGRARSGEPVDPDSVLPYAVVYRNLARLGALQRLVVIDACQAEAVVDDPGVRRIEELVDGGAQRARTAYLFGARRGEPAGETSKLAHGLMTYALLKGLGESRLEPAVGPALFDQLPNADRNQNRVITTEELRWYITATIPVLAGQFPTLVRRTGAGSSPALPETKARPVQDPHIQASDANFPLIVVPAPLENE